MDSLMISMTADRWSAGRALAQRSTRISSTISYRFMPCSGRKAKRLTSATSAAKQHRQAENVAYYINVVGNSDLPGDTTFHAFLWTKATGMQDLGTFSGDVASASISIKDAGSAVGLSLNSRGG